MPAPTSASWKRAFFQGVTSGIGWAIGATIGFAFLVAVVGTFFSLLAQIPALTDLVQPFVQIIQTVSDPRDEVVRIDRR